MLVQFVTDHKLTSHGLSARIYHLPIKTICKDWLNVPSGFLTFQDPLTTSNCSWVITASIGSTISIQFHDFEVKLIFFVSLCNFFLICHF